MAGRPVALIAQQAVAAKSTALEALLAAKDINVSHVAANLSLLPIEGCTVLTTAIDAARQAMVAAATTLPQVAAHPVVVSTNSTPVPVTGAVATMPEVVDTIHMPVVQLRHNCLQHVFGPLVHECILSLELCSLAVMGRGQGSSAACHD